LKQHRGGWSNSASRSERFHTNNSHYQKLIMSTETTPAAENCCTTPAVASNPVERKLRTVAPPVDLLENSTGFRIVADVPGVSADALSLEVEEGRLTFTATPAALPSGKLLAGAANELAFRRTFSLPRTVDLSKVTAQLQAGVLTIDLPKLESVQPRKITIASA